MLLFPCGGAQWAKGCLERHIGKILELLPRDLWEGQVSHPRSWADFSCGAAERELQGVGRGGDGTGC